MEVIATKKEESGRKNRPGRKNEGSGGGGELQTYLHAIYFIGAFTKMRKATVSFFFCSTILPRGTIRLSLDRFSKIFIFEYFRNSFEKIQVLLKSENNNAQIK